MCQSTPRAESELPISREAPALAREFLRAASCTEHHNEVLEDAVLLVSELVTNSILHGGPPVVVAIDCDVESLRVRVRDGSSELPAPREAKRVDVGGRGLAIVANLSDDWGVEKHGDDSKHVWFVLRKVS